MTITDLNEYAKQINEQFSPLDKMQVTLRRDALSYIGAYLHDRYRSVCKSLSDPKTKPGKRSNREMEKAMLEASIYAINNPKKL